jgi:hypothetical protein
MATLSKTGTVTYEEWLGMPVVQDGREEVVKGEIRRHFPNVQVDIAQIWPD